jgi:hypothetical protein
VARVDDAAQLLVELEKRVRLVHSSVGRNASTPRKSTADDRLLVSMGRGTSEAMTCSSRVLPQR